MNVLVTGGAGYIGSFMIDHLLERGDKVFVVDSLERGFKEEINPKAKFSQGNLLDKEFLSTLFNDNQFDCVIHFAGFISMAESMKNPRIYFENNTFGSLNLIDVAAKNKVRSFVFSSTAGVYGNPKKIPIPEDHPLNPTNPYGESKLVVEKILMWYQKLFGINFVSLRYFNASGGSLDGKRGERHDPETHIIPLAIKSVLEDRPFKLFGIDYSTPDGTCIRDYIHVIDLAEAHVLALEKLKKDKGGFFYNVGTGRGHSNREVLEMVKKVSGRTPTIIEEKRRSGDAEILIADVQKINRELDFSPKYSDLKTIVETAWRWHRNQI